MPFRIAFFLSSLFGAYASHGAIYGKDNRTNLGQEKEHRWVNIAKSVAVMIDDRKFHSASKNAIQVKCNSQKEHFNLCPDVNFAEEPKFGDCSGFLVAKDLLVTARHCVPKITTCDHYKWVFGVDDSSRFTPNSVEIKNENIYSCIEILDHSPMGQVYRDYAVLRLDRPVPGRKFLKLNMKDDVRIGDKLAVIGYPSGMLVKIAKGGIVRSITNVALRASLDAWGGNSGSPVVNERTLEVEGILVAGDTDIKFDRKNKCWRDKTYKMNEGTGERVTLMKEVTLP